MKPVKMTINQEYYATSKTVQTATIRSESNYTMKVTQTSRLLAKKVKTRVLP